MTFGNAVCNQVSGVIDVRQEGAQALASCLQKQGVMPVVVLVRRGAQRNPERLQREMEEVFRALLPARRALHVQQHGPWRPPLEVFETESSLEIIAELAGVDEADLNIVADAGMVSIRGSRRDQREGSQRRYREIGIAYGEFEADVYLPFPVDIDHADAQYERGMLRITLPRIPARTIVPRHSGNSR